MAAFSYQVRDEDGKIIKGVMQAGSERELLEKLRGQGYTVTRISSQRASALSMDIGKKLTRVKNKDLVSFYSQLRSLLHAGIPLLTALSDVSQQCENIVLKETLEKVQKDVEGGGHFSDSLKKHPSVFPDIAVNMIRAGETSGALDKALERVASMADRQEEMRSQVKSALTYPVIVLFIAIVVVIFMVVYVIPKFLPIFAQSHVELPLITRSLMGLSDFMRHRSYIIIGAIIGSVVAFKQYIKRERGRLQFDRLKLKLPIFGPLARKLAIARFAHVLGSLSASGISILESLSIVQGIIGNAVLAGVLSTVQGKVRRGEGISGPLEMSGEFPPLLIRMVSVGEKTGSLDKMLEELADFYDRETYYTLKGLGSMLEPIMLALLGVIVGVIALALFLPMFNLYEAVK